MSYSEIGLNSIWLHLESLVLRLVMRCIFFFLFLSIIIIVFFAFRFCTKNQKIEEAELAFF